MGSQITLIPILKLLKEIHMQKETKTETVAEFVARGGLVNKVATKSPKKTRKKLIKDAELDEPIDMSALPMSLKIKYGVR
jgi:hypothetical protein